MPLDPIPERRGLSIRQEILLGFGLALAAVILIAVVACRSTRGFIKSAELAAHTRLVLENHQLLLRHSLEAESAIRGYLITGDDRFVKAFYLAEADFAIEYEAQNLLVVADPQQRINLAKIRDEFSRKFEALSKLIKLRRAEGPEAAAREFSRVSDEGAKSPIKSWMADFEREEQRVLAQRAGMSASIGNTTIFAVALGSAITLTLLGLALAIILRDDTARRKAEELLAEERNLLRSLIDTIPEHIYIKDRRGRYVLDNVAHRKFLKVDDISEVIGKSVFYFFPQELATLYHSDDQTILQTGNPVINREEPAVTTEGKLLWLSTTKVPLRDINGAFIGLVCVSTDISERKIAEEKLRVFAAQLERSNNDLRDFASVASHDLQEPLRKIQTFSDRLRAKCFDSVGEQGRDYLDRVQNAAGRMQTLIQDLLILSHVSSKAQPFVEVDLAQIVKDVLSDLEIRIEQTGAKIEVGFLPKIEADPVQMRQLFQNLLTNGLKFHKPGQSPEIIISAKILSVHDYQLAGASPGDDVCQVMVKDNGIGFDEQYVEQIFAVFQRLHSKTEYEGTGIGLAVCRKIANRHGGSIVAKSAKGEGATFIVMLPVKQISKT